METLPLWLQFLAALATVLSSIGVIIAIVQLKISSNQFHQQLKITARQFRLTNQGYLNFFLNQNYIRAVYSNPATDSQLDLDALYQAIEFNGTFENVGNLPVKIIVKSFQVLINGNLVLDTANDNVTAIENVVFPKQKLQYQFGIFYKDKTRTSFKIEDITSQKVTYNILATYHDYNDSTSVKTLNRQLKLVGLNIIVTAFNDVFGEV